MVSIAVSGKVAGLRTTLLGCLAASLAMLQINALLLQAGKMPQSFAVLDLMRLPLGILSGVRLIGAGAILRKDALVKGVKTAATLWFVTVIGLLFGGGQLGLGVAGRLLGIVVLWLFKALEAGIPRENQGDSIANFPTGEVHHHHLFSKESSDSAVSVA